jgi:mono/diheme cytochrome c family protein
MAGEADMRRLHRTALASLLALSGPAFAAELGDVKTGHEYAKKVCAECHEVEGVDAFSPNPDAPSFKAVANTPGMTARALSVWLHTSHPTMPDFIIKPDDIDNVVAYILSLRTTKQGL